MKLTKKALGVFAATTVFIVGCSASNQLISEESIGLRNTDLYSEKADTVGDKTEYIKKAAGESVVIQRAFENAPPMIPHDVEGMLPITINNNACTGCHAPEVAPSLNATPMPKSHFTDFRPKTALSKDGKIMKEGMVVDNTSDLKTASNYQSQLVSARFNCSACHAPQSIGTKDPVKNEFKAEFRTSNSNKKSNLVDNINEGVDTLK